MNVAPESSALPAWQRRSVYLFAGLTWLTGVAWIIFHYFVQTTDQFGFEGPHPLQHWWLVAHAAAALIGLWLFGLLWNHHIARGWQNRWRRPSGGTLFGVIVWLAVSGCALYYIGSDRVRSWTSLAHWIAGILALLPFLLHDRKRKT